MSGLLTIWFIFLIGLAVCILIYRITTHIHLNNHSVQVVATVDEVKQESYWATEQYYDGRGNRDRSVMRQHNVLYANWQHPQTLQWYTFKAVVGSPKKFHHGMAVSFEVDPDKPNLYRPLNLP